jgi:hypothetical protein
MRNIKKITHSSKNNGEIIPGPFPPRTTMNNESIFCAITNFTNRRHLIRIYCQQLGSESGVLNNFKIKQEGNPGEIK